MTRTTARPAGARRPRGCDGRSAAAAGGAGVFWAPNAFRSVGLNERRAVVAVTSELLRRDLTTAELEAVVARELAHVANRDGLVMTFVSVPLLPARLMATRRTLRGGQIFFLLLYWPVFLVSLFLMWTLSRYREYVADRGAAVITGAPERLMSALQKIAGRPARGDLPRQARRSGALHRRPPEGLAQVQLFSDHPPLDKRLERLAELSRELGKAA